jgi:DGQHR domain-containing protein
VGPNHFGGASGASEAAGVQTKFDQLIVSLAHFFEKGNVEMPSIILIEGQTLKSGVRIVVGSIPMKLLAHRVQTPWRDARTKEGYQRRPTPSRIAKLAGEIRKHKVDIPTAVLLNARDSSWESAISQNDASSDFFTFDLDRYNGVFSVVDGQHRIEALRQLYVESEEEYGGFKLQFVMMLGANEGQELEQFYVVNSTAKSVKTDLALDLLKQRADHDGTVMNHLVEIGQDWKVRAQDLTEMLNDKSSTWRNRIRLANEIKGLTTIPSSSFVVSLQKFLAMPLMQAADIESQYKIIDTFWMGIRSVMPNPFDYPQDYTLMKGIGVWAMHDALPSVIEVIRSRGLSLYERQSYADVLEPMFDKLDGENLGADTVSGADFWLVAPKGGAAGTFSSSAGKRVLSSKIRQAMPKPDLE